MGNTDGRGPDGGQVDTGFGGTRQASIREVLDGLPAGSTTAGPALTPQGPFADDPFREDPGLLTGPPPRVGKAPGSYGLDVEALLPAAGSASALSGELHRLISTFDHGTPPGTPGFMVGFQAGEMNRQWGQKVSRLSDGLEALSTKILKTRWAYQDAEHDNTSLFQGL